MPRTRARRVPCFGVGIEAGPELALLAGSRELVAEVVRELEGTAERLGVAERGIGERGGGEGVVQQHRVAALVVGRQEGGDDSSNPIQRRRARAELGDPLHDPRAERRRLHVDGVDEQLLLRSEVVLDQRHRDPGLGGDLPEADAGEAAPSRQAADSRGDLTAAPVVIHLLGHGTPLLTRFDLAAVASPIVVVRSYYELRVDMVEMRHARHRSCRCAARASAVQALRGVDLDVCAGEVVGLLGPNGAGKTTLVHIIATLLDADDGHVSVCGADVARSGGGRRHLGLAGQYASVDELLTGRENLELIGRLYGLGDDDCRARCTR